MTVTPDDDFAAAEYALGTLDPGERAVMEARRLREPDLDEAIRAWEARLAPLAEAAGPIEPPRDLLPTIEARIRAAPPEPSGNAAVTALRRSLTRAEMSELIDMIDEVARVEGPSAGQTDAMAVLSRRIGLSPAG